MAEESVRMDPAVKKEEKKIQLRVERWHKGSHEFRGGYLLRQGILQTGNSEPTSATIYNVQLFQLSADKFEC